MFQTVGCLATQKVVQTVAMRVGHLVAQMVGQWAVWMAVCWVASKVDTWVCLKAGGLVVDSAAPKDSHWVVRSVAC